MAKTYTGSTAGLQSPLITWGSDGAPLSTEESLYATYLYAINNKLSLHAFLLQRFCPWWSSSRQPEQKCLIFGVVIPPKCFFRVWKLCG